MADIERVTTKNIDELLKTTRKKLLRKKKILNMNFENPDRPLNIKFRVL